MSLPTKFDEWCPIDFPAEHRADELVKVKTAVHSNVNSLPGWSCIEWYLYTPGIQEYEL